MINNENINFALEKLVGFEYDIPRSDSDCIAMVLHKMGTIVRKFGPRYGVRLDPKEPLNFGTIKHKDFEIEILDDGNITFSQGKQIKNDRLEVDLRNHIKRVIYNPPATIIFWKDGEKTVVKGSDADYDNGRICPELGIVHAIAKRALGNKGNYSTVIKRLVKSTEPKKEIKK